MSAKTAEAAEMVFTRPEGVDDIVKHHVWGSLGIGLIPIPVVDFVALTGVQLNMLRKLAKVYKVGFSKDKGKSIIASLVGGGIPTTVSVPVASLVKTIPFIGQTAGALTMSALAGATTYALGKVFIQHFASGGTFLNFDPDAVRDYYNEMFKEGQKAASEATKAKEEAGEQGAY